MAFPDRPTVQMTQLNTPWAIHHQYILKITPYRHKQPLLRALAYPEPHITPNTDPTAATEHSCALQLQHKVDELNRLRIAAAACMGHMPPYPQADHMHNGQIQDPVLTHNQSAAT